MVKTIFYLAFLLRFALLFFPSHGDLANHADWGVRFFEYGSRKFYAPETNVWSHLWPNQPPLTIYLFAAVRKTYEAIYQLLWWVNLNVPIFPSKLMFWVEKSLYPLMLKLPASLADLGIGWLIYRFVKKKKNAKKARVVLALWLFNPITFYNSAMWGQTDAIINFFALASILLLLEKRAVGALLLFVVSLLFKFSLILFLPIILLIIWKEKLSFKKWAFIFASVFALLYFVSLPFVYDKSSPLVWLIALYKDKILKHQLHYLTANAFNFWGAVSGMGFKSDWVKLAGLSVKYWSWIFLVLWLVPIFVSLYKKISGAKVIFSTFFVAFSSFVFLTNMHERYLYPVFPYLLLSTIFYPKLKKLYFLLSGIHLMNLYHWWWKPRIGFLIKLFEVCQGAFPRLLSLINVLLLIWTMRFFLYSLKGKTIIKGK